MVGGFTGWGNWAGAGTISGGSSIASEMGWKSQHTQVVLGSDLISKAW